MAWTTCGRRPEVEQQADHGVTEIVEPDVGHPGCDMQALEAVEVRSGRLDASHVSCHTLWHG